MARDFETEFEVQKAAYTAKTMELKDRLSKGETLDDILPEAYALVREAARRVLHTEHYRVQLMGGILRACEKRPVSINDIERAVDDIESRLQNSLDREVTSVHIGELVMEKLKGIDEVAYVRFASVYKQFKDVNAFMEELSSFLDKK
mgnify:CR=1 FL=1